MGKKSKGRRLEVRFSLSAVACLMLCWVGISVLAFYVGMLMGRDDRDQFSRLKFSSADGVSAKQALAELTFENLLMRPSPADKVPQTVKEKKEKRTATSREPIQQLSVAMKKAPAARAVARKDPKPAASEKGATTGTKLLQVASFREKGSAGRLIKKLRDKGYRCFPAVSTNANSGTEYYRVFVGPYANLEEAAETKKNLEIKNGFKGIIIRSRP